MSVAEVPTASKESRPEIWSKVQHLPEYLAGDEIPGLPTSQEVQQKLQACVAPKGGKLQIVLKESSFRSLRPRSAKIEVVTESKGQDVIKALKEASKKAHESQPILRRLLREDEFATNVSSFGNLFGTNPEQEFLQLLGGPYSKQLYLGDYLLMHAEAWWEYNHNPIARALVNVMTNFVVGRGIKFKSKNQGIQTSWDNWYENDKGWEKVRLACSDGSWQGEIMSRLFIQRDKSLTLRFLDPSTIWEVISDPEDAENVFGYWQQYPGAYNMFTMKVDGGFVPTTSYTLRIIPADEVIHWKLNFVSGEKRGRTDYFPILAWLKRDRDLVNAKVTQAMFERMFAWDVAINGSQDDVTAFKMDPNQQTVPSPGSSWIHSEQMKVTPMSAKVGSHTGRDETVLDVIRHCAAPFGLPVEWIAYGEGSTKAMAIAATSPATKFIQLRQLSMEMGFLRPLLKMIVQAQILLGRLPKGTVPEGEFSWPEPAPEDTDLRIKRLDFALRRQVISHRDFATQMAGEISYSQYDYDAQQNEIQNENAKRAKTADAVLQKRANDAAQQLGADKTRPMSSTDKQQTTKSSTKINPEAPISDPEPDIDPEAP